MAIRWDKLTVKAQEAVQRANDLASEHGNPELQPVHILAALLEDREGIVAPLLERVGLPVQIRAVAGDGRRLTSLPQGFGRRRGAGVTLQRSQPAAGGGLQGGGELQGRVRLDRAPAAGDDQAQEGRRAGDASEGGRDV